VKHYFSYWGKTRSKDGAGSPCHLLPFHCLDVAACAKTLLEVSSFTLGNLTEEMNWSPEVVRQVIVFFLAIHDIGKFASAFQDLMPDLLPRPAGGKKRIFVDRLRHDTLGWLLWKEKGRRSWFGQLSMEAWDFWDLWMRVATGHHGLPPREQFGVLGAPRLSDYCSPFDSEAAASFVRDVAEFLLPDGLPEPDEPAYRALLRHSWRLAGLAVLADWLGSGDHFAYDDTPLSLKDYWENTALPKAREAVRAAGLEACAVRAWEGATQLVAFPALSPLQHYAATVELGEGPQIFLLEDITGAGKTEAALLLANRLMAAGYAQGLYFALPTMATANQMYERTAGLYRRLYADGAEPSLLLAHGARYMVEGFRNSILSDRSPEHVLQAVQEDSAQCSGWLADSRKKALLADVGVGTVDQVLLGVLPVRHQSLRLLGMAAKVLIVDEVHAYDDYMSKLLQAVVEVQAMQGGSVVLLSATVPMRLRQELIAAFARGRGWKRASAAPDMRYPLATQLAEGAVRTVACETRIPLMRRVTVRPLHSEREVVEHIWAAAKNGQCVCWIRNTVSDARRGHALLQQAGAARLGLFHSHFTLSERLKIEGEVLRAFGRKSAPSERQGRILVATQVVEQSLDLDFDELFVDLAPVDLLIQRAGRLRRHARMPDGTSAPDGVERRGEPVLYMLCPEMVQQPGADWYARMFPKAQYVYPNAGELWLTQKALLDAGCIVTPGEVGQTGSVRSLVEAVYGVEFDAIPTALQANALAQEGKRRADESQANFNTIPLQGGYQEGLSGKWYDEAEVSPRLSEDQKLIYLAREKNGELRPFCDAAEFAWELSSVRLDARRVDELAEEWKARFDSAIASLRRRERLLEGEAFVLPMVREKGRWVGMGAKEKKDKKTVRVTYVEGWGVDVESAD
jgi:CRISPR-associated endonuclease/helicase Cas3